MLREIAGNFVAIPVGQNVVDCKNMLHLNETSVFLWNELQNEITYDVLLKNMAIKYEASEDEISILKTDLDDFLKELIKMKLLTE